ncbi:1-aminocyclopropane-1-carboxylate deaminase/D-cysteine desulfhydrase [Cyclobacterium xiamenense]|uniref:1-aminocyclopropane-1-carboxylate deaminase/D-cysteine desulfhydrase n=1 Tax=Cyclobacterium xiamenense TaxID=1297121 RepID=UPI0035D08A42
MEPANYPIYQTLNHPLLEETGVRLTVKRLDRMHPGLQGNKYYKLRYNIQEAIKQKANTVVTFGGAYSNHIHATAFACKQSGLRSIGVIRGETPLPLNPTLSDAVANGMQLHCLSRSEYREKQSPELLGALERRFGAFFLIPEGGTNALAIQGTREILTEADAAMNVIALPVGTGGTFAGIAATALPGQRVLGFSALKGDFIRKEVAQLMQAQGIRPHCDWEISTDFHFGGYARFNAELIDFLQDMRRQAQLPLDPVYTGKMMFGLWAMIREGCFPKGSRLLVLHTGGLQGVRGFNQRHGLQI